MSTGSNGKNSSSQQEFPTHYWSDYHKSNKTSLWYCLQNICIEITLDTPTKYKSYTGLFNTPYRMYLQPFGSFFFWGGGEYIQIIPKFPKYSETTEQLQKIISQKMTLVRSTMSTHSPHLQQTIFYPRHTYGKNHHRDIIIFCEVIWTFIKTKRGHKINEKHLILRCQFLPHN